MLYHKNQSVTVNTPARLHLGFVDLGGALGRKFISAGVTIDGFGTKLTVTPAKRFSGSGPCEKRAVDYARALFEKWNLDGGCSIDIHYAIPQHAGLGSGTQLALCVGTAIAKLWQVEVSTAEIAQELGRGARSGIGIGAFDQGGVIVDGGRGQQTRVPPIVARHPFPEAWRILIILDQSDSGLHGVSESDAFSTLPRFSDQCAGFLSRQVLARVLPGVIENNLQDFGDGVRQIQQRVGDYFAPAQGGRYTSQAVAQVLEYLIEKQIAGVGQSSWGPTGFAFFDSDTAAHSVLRELQNTFNELPQLAYKVVQGNNHGSVIKTEELDQTSTNQKAG
ncbi:MAG: beta-ribofuranosylaminobenzene 5'-phosphate synthase family protein [Pseudomonadota bacterium]